jgi:hypothetical protein
MTTVIATNVPAVIAAIRIAHKGNRKVAYVSLSGPLEEMDRVDVQAVIDTLGCSGLFAGRVLGETGVAIDAVESAVRALRDEAGQAGDLEQVALCDEALSGETDGASSEQIAAVIVEAAAQDDEAR